MITPQWFEIETQEKHDSIEILVYYNRHRGSAPALASMKGIIMMMYRYLPMRMMGGHFFGLLLAVLLVVGIVLLIVTLASRKIKSPAPAATQSAAAPAQDRFLSLLSEQKATSGMGLAEFEERRLILEGGRGDNHANAEIVSLKERYARAELTTSAYIEARNKLLGVV
jgi:uncharacterized membrane protein